MGSINTWRVMPAVWALICAPLAYAGTINAHVTTPDGTPVTAAVITATPVGQGPVAVKSSAKSLMVQEHKQFVPFVLPVQLGTTVEFPNRDPFRHQVYSFAPAKTFELKLYGKSEVSTVTFDKEGVVPLGCNIHDNMLAYIYVVGTPHFSTTNEKGESTIGQLPAGNYVVKVWHPNQKAGQGDAGTLAVTATDTATVSVQLDLKRTRTQTKPGAVDETYN